jgi:hypothetical protein
MYFALKYSIVSADGKIVIPEAAQRRLSALAGLVELQATLAVRTLALELLTRNALPAIANMDAAHVAIAAVNGIEYLLTWNCTHIANAYTRPKIEATCRSLGYEPPIICTPQELTEN